MPSIASCGHSDINLTSVFLSLSLCVFSDKEEVQRKRQKSLPHPHFDSWPGPPGGAGSSGRGAGGYGGPGGGLGGGPGGPFLTHDIALRYITLHCLSFTRKPE